MELDGAIDLLDWKRRVFALYANVARTNAGSIRVLVKCGFTLVDERTVTDEALGEAIDELVMELR